MKEMSPFRLAAGSTDEVPAVNSGSIRGVLLLDSVPGVVTEGVLGAALDFLGFEDLEDDRDGVSLLVFVGVFRLLALLVDHGRCVRIFCIKNDLGVFSVVMFPVTDELTKRNWSWDILGF